MKPSRAFILGLALPILILIAALGRGPGLGRRRIALAATASGGEAWLRGYDRLCELQPALAARLELRLRASGVEASWDGCDALIVEVLDDEVTGAHLAAIEAGPARRWAIGAPHPRLPEAELARLGLRRDPELEAFWREGSPDDIAGALHLIAARLGLSEGPPPSAPRARPAAGLFDIDERGEARFLTGWEDWSATHPGAAPRVAILDFRASVRRGEWAPARALFEAARQSGLEPVGLYSQPGSRALSELLSGPDGRPRVEVILALHLKFYEPEAPPRLEALGVPIINLIKVGGRSLSEWRREVQGLSSGEVPRQLAIPEMHAMIAPTVVAGRERRGEGLAMLAEPAGAAQAAARARGWAQLRATPPRDRRIALMFWNYPPGKQNIGASYLNVTRSLPRILADLRAAGYDIGDEAIPGDDAFEQQLVARARNIGRYAPGELARLAAESAAVKLPLTTYERWYAELPERFRREVEARWGPPRDADIMTVREGDELSFVLPAWRWGNLVLLPQPDRARTQNLEALYHAQDLPPHHQYIAAYLWLRRGFEAHAVVHTGTHGTHEWLSGKESGLASWNAGEALIGGLPVLYPYIMDDIGEGIVAARRGAAAIIDHLTPALALAPLSPDLAALEADLRRWREVAATNPEAATLQAEELRARITTLGIDAELRGASLPEVEDYIAELRAQSIPLGLHTFGRSPEAARLDGMATLLASATALSEDQARAALRACGPAEAAALLEGLAGGYIEPGPGNDPIRNPSALPTGRHFFTFDPRAIPSPEAWELGRRLAEELLARHAAERGATPERVALQVWGVETIRSQGVQEAQALALLGLRPQRDALGRITELELIPRAELGRPRVDVVLHATSLYRDTFPGLIELFDSGVQLALSSPEPDNPLRARVTKLRDALIDEGISPPLATRRAAVRVFCEPSGHHGSKLAPMTHASGSWDEASQVAQTYIRRMGHGYGGGLWGAPMEREMRDALAGTEAIVHTSASRLYGVLDNDDVFSYGGSIALGVREVQGGASPPFYVTDIRVPGQERHTRLERYLGQELRSRGLNPAFLRELMSEGYAGGRELWKGAEYLWGWQVVLPEAVQPEHWQGIYELWLEDRAALGITEFLREHNPHARTTVASRLLEVTRKGYWSPDDEVRRRLAEIIIEDVGTYGVACDHLVCDNPDLTREIQRVAEELGGIEAPKLERWRERVEAATQQSLEKAYEAHQLRKTRLHEAPPPAPEAEAAAPQPVRGQVMEEEVLSAPESPTPSAWSAMATFAIAGGLILAGALRGALRA